MTDRQLSGRDLARLQLAQARELARQRVLVPKRAEPVRRSRAKASSREPMSCAAVMKGLVEEAGWSEGTSVGGVLEQWAKIVGPERARNWRAASYDSQSRALLVVASSTAWSTALRLQQAQVLALLDQRFPSTVTKLQVQVGSVASASEPAVGVPASAPGLPRLKDWSGRAPSPDYRAVRDQLRAQRRAIEVVPFVNPFLPEDYGRLGREPAARFLQAEDISKALAEAQRSASRRRSLLSHERAAEVARQRRSR